MAPLQARFRLHHPASAVLSLAVLLISVAQVIPSLSITSFFVSAADFAMPIDSSSGYKSDYTRSNEVQQQCQPYLKDLETDPSFWREAVEKRWPSISVELTFHNGEWVQEAPNIKGRRRPLMPFVPRPHFLTKGYNLTDSHPSMDIEGPTHLVSNWITDVQLPFHGVPPSNSKGNMVNVSVVLEMALSSVRPLYHRRSGRLQLQGGFEMSPGFSRLVILMEGVYAELKNGERLLCLLGSTKLPSRGKNESHPWDWLNNSASTKLPSTGKHKSGSPQFSPPLSYDSQIMAVLHFPKELSLTSRAVLGRLQSLQTSTHPNYFDPIHLFSQLGASAHYHFKSGELVRSACDNPRQRPGELSPSKNLYRGSSFCTVVQQLLPYQWVDILPNWNCTLSNTTCMKLGPFQSSPQVHTMPVDRGFNNAQLQVQGIQCLDYPEEDGSWSANMSAVFRAVLPSGNHFLASEQTSLDGLTLAAEGSWNSKSGELCMVGCRGGMNLSSSSSQASIKEACNTKIRIYMPLTLSLSQRSVFEGSISSTRGSSDDFYPLSFHLPFHSWGLPFDLTQSMIYEYTKIKEAEDLCMQDDDPVGTRKSIKKSLMEYPPSANHRGDFMVLADDLSLQTLAITNPDSSKAAPHLQHFVELNMVTIEDLVKVSWMRFAEVAAPENATDGEVEKKVDIEQKSFYRVATDLKITDDFGSTVMAIAAEGVYNPTFGRSYLLGCRELLNATWKTFQKNAESLEGGLDCKIKLKVEYPPTNSRWFMDPTVLLTVTSTRTEDDPFFFPKITLKTFPILYKRQREESVSRKSLETGLSVLTLSLIVGCIVSQLMYVKAHADSTPYISLVMLGVQAVGFSIPLITGMEAFFASTSSDSEGRVSGSVYASMRSASEAVSDSDGMVTLWSEARWGQVGRYMVNMLTLATFLLTLKLVQKVYKSRIRMLSMRPLESWRVPSDRKVLAICAGVHALGFIIVLISHFIGMSKRPINSWSMYMDHSNGGLHNQHDWERILKEYYGLVQDLFLLPQAVGNHLWVVKGKPLRMLFYVGVTVLRLLPHVYDGLRPLVFDPYSADAFRYANPSSDFYSKTGDIAIPVFAVLLAVVIYIQQRWSNGLKWGKGPRLQGSSKPMQSMGYEVYERLPAKTSEAEMVGSVTAGHDDLIEHDNGHHTGDGGNP